ncbi:hypothetical protein H0W80_02175 [Candidatus Saccharibacteria bacterium]|nr:hypothetical protein [Candidatus Saccharibacteria bacterium]
MIVSQKSKSLVTASAVASAVLVPLAASAATDASTGATSAQPTGTPTDLNAQITIITNTMLLAIGVVSVIMLIVGGFRYVLSNGNEKAITGAKDTILYAIIGIVVALLSFAIVNFVLGRFS